LDWQATKAQASGFMRRKDVDWASMQLLALDDIAQSLVVQENEGVVPIPLSASQLPGWNSGPLPTDFARTRAALNAGGREMTFIDIKGLLSVPGSARHCAISGSAIYATGSSLTLIYSTRLAPLIEDTAHNYLSDHYSNVFLFGLVKLAAERYQDFEAQAVHKGAYDEAIAKANEGYAWATLAAGTEVRSPYQVIGAN
jgi:hypothetical protein